MRFVSCWSIVGLDFWLSPVGGTVSISFSSAVSVVYCVLEFLVEGCLGSLLWSSFVMISFDWRFSGFISGAFVGSALVC